MNGRKRASEKKPKKNDAKVNRNVRAVDEEEREKMNGCARVFVTVTYALHTKSVV